MSLKRLKSGRVRSSFIYGPAPKRLISLALILALLTFIHAAAQAADTGSAATEVGTLPETTINADSGTSSNLLITDGRGQEVKLPGLPQRILITGKASFMVLDAVYLFPDIRAKIVGKGKDGQGMDAFLSAIDPEYPNKTSLGREPSPEQIAACKPDVVLMKKASAETLGRSLESLGIPVVCVDFETPEQYDRDLAILGRLLGQEARAKTLGDLIHTRLNLIADALAGLDETKKPRVLLLYYDPQNGSVSFNVPPTAWMQTLLVKMAGGRPLWEGTQLGQGWTKTGFEQIAAWDADQIFIVSYFANPDKVVADLKADEHWQALRAVKNGNLLAFPGDLLSWDQPDPRWVLGLTWLAARMHPELFRGLDMHAEVSRFFKDFYGVDDSIIDKIIRPALYGNL
ncbi:MAG TPA: ABC transporter substrate-binding protein [Candidatus Rifleibacterium sp.]|nr:ABC transporter substrate-binding protein [Candidatus Rifleibacterium sp.]